MIQHQRAAIVKSLQKQKLHPIHEGIGVNLKVDGQYIVYLHIQDRNDSDIKSKVETACEGLHFVSASPISYTNDNQAVVEYWVFLTELTEE
jgi:hypothetical protein